MEKLESPLLNRVSSGPPTDKGRMAYFILLLEGLGNLFPWNVFITASTYYASRFCGTSFESNFENFFSVSYTVAQTIGLAFSVVYSEKFTFRTRIITPLTFYCFVFALTTIFVLIPFPSTLLFWITLLSTTLCGLLTASLSGGLFGLAGKLPPLYTGALMTGQGFAGLTVSISNIITTIASSDTTCVDNDLNDDGTCVSTIDYGAFAYFMISTVILFSCIISYIIFQRLSFIR